MGLRAIKVADWFIRLNNRYVAFYGGEYLSNGRLQRLLYYAQGTFLGVYGEPLFDDPIMKWRNGPAVEKVWKAYCSYDDGGIISKSSF